jgi:DNA-binding LacI/PurR family transcriptional regulator
MPLPGELGCRSDRLCGELQPGADEWSAPVGDQAQMDSIICYGDRTAIDVLHALQQQGRQVPLTVA